MKRFKEYCSQAKNWFIAVNAFCAVTVMLYYLTKADGFFFNVAAVIWYIAMLANMVLAVTKRKSVFCRTVIMMAPVVLIQMSSMLGTNADSPAMGMGIQIMAIMYFIFSAWHSYYLFSGKYPEKEAKPAKIIGLVFYGLFYLIAMGMFLSFNYYTLISSQLTMSSMLNMFVGFASFFPMLAFSVSLGFYRRLKTRGLKWLPNVILCLVVITFLAAFIPVFSAPNTAENANAEYTRVFGGEAGEKFSYSLPETVFGSIESGYTVQKDQQYMTMEYNGKEYELAYDMYKPAGDINVTPVIVRMHGSGGKKGVRNNALMNEALASQGYTVFDIDYGNEKVKPGNDELTENICTFLNYIYEKQDELSIDTDNIIISGGSRGGKMALKTCVAWSSNSYFDLHNKVEIKGAVIYWGFMNDVFEREGDERIVSLEELNEDIPPILFVDVTHDGSVQGQNMMEGVLYTLGVPAANIELRYGMHGANTNYYGVWGQLCDYYLLRFADDMTRNE